jgi:hypothetical protein
VNREEIQRLVSLPDMPEEDKKALKDIGRDPKNWITYAMLSEFWGTPESYITTLRTQGKIPMGIKAGVHKNKRFLPSKCAFGPYLPKEAKRFFHSIRMRELGNDSLEEAGIGQTAVRHKGDIQKTRKQIDYLKTLARCVDMDDWREVIQKALADAKEGDRHARKWLSDYLVGTPIKRVASIVQHRHTKFTDEERAELMTRMILGLDEEDQDEEEEVREDGDDSVIIEGTYTNS